MVATTDQKARLLDLLVGVLELTRDGKRDAGEVADVLQIIKEEKNFAIRLLSSNSKPTTFPTWKTITLGTFRNVKDLRKALKDGNFRIGDWASDIMGQRAFKLAKEKIELALVLLTVAELGFPKGATRKEIYDRALELGLKLCPAEVGPQLRLQYGDQPKDEWLTIAMEPIADSVGYPRVFRVGHGHGGRWLVADLELPVCFWDAEDQFVFCR